MTEHSFADEHKDPYFMVAAFIRPAQITKTRQEMMAMVLPRQRRIHFNKERNSRRSQVMSRLIELRIEAAIYQAADAHNEKEARRRCLTALIRDHLARDVRRLVIEQDDSLIDFDRRLLNRETTGTQHLTYEHVSPYQEPLLAIPDAVAWCWARGGHWQVKAKHLVTTVHQV